MKLVFDKILSYDVHDEYSARLPEPYIWQLEKGKQKLVYFGANHSHDPENHQYDVLRGTWAAFVRSTEKSARVALEEGSLSPVFDTDIEAIERAAEGGLLQRLSAREQVKILCPEPSPQEEYAAVSAQFGSEMYFFYWGCMYAAQRYRLPENPDPEIYIKHALKSDVLKILGKNSAEFTWERFIELCKTYETAGFGSENEEWWESAVNPVKTGYILNTVSRFVSRFRDEYVVQEIEKLWKEGNSIFVVYGRSHAFMQEPYLRSVLR